MADFLTYRDVNVGLNNVLVPEMRQAADAYVHQLISLLLVEIMYFFHSVPSHYPY